MKRTVVSIVAVTAVAAATAGVAVAAASPTVTTRAATRISNSGARLNATVNPNGVRTGYTFQYGLTTAYGLSTTSHSAGAGAKPVTVHVGVGGLEPGTVYHYRVVALSRAGEAVGADHAFKTTGPPPPGVATGAAINVGKTTVDITGTVSTNGAATTWMVQYGLTTGYGTQTFAQVIPNSVTPTPVSVVLTGLTPGTLFHYRLVGIHGSKVVADGLDGTFFTEPATRPKPRMTAHTRPSRDRHRPFLFTTTGGLHGASFIPPNVRCAGQVGVRYFRGRRQIAFALVGVAPNCTFTAEHRFHRLRGRGERAIRIKVSFRGNGYIRRVTRTDHVTVG
jgi:hypothetical protein